MNLAQLNDDNKNADISYTGLVGTVTTTYAALVHAFGQPDRTNGDKTTAEWCLRFDDGTVASIYDWKEPSTPMGLHSWHVGGKSVKALLRVEAHLGLDLTGGEAA